MRLSEYEKETIILFNEEEPYVKVYTHNTSMKDILDKLCKKYPEKFMFLYNESGGKYYKVEKYCMTISFNK